jgi:hypothetical protein
MQHHHAAPSDLGSANLHILIHPPTHPPTPCCCSGPSGPPLVGAPARRQAAANPLNTFTSVKRLIGEHGVAVWGRESQRCVVDGIWGKRLGGGGGGGPGAVQGGAAYPLDTFTISKRRIGVYRIGEGR